MTVHASKGLEFDYVFVPVLEQGVFPHAKSLEEDEFGVGEFDPVAGRVRGGTPEEKRLCHVAFTRARKRLIVSRADQRFRKGTMPSTFLGAAGIECAPVKSPTKVFRPRAQQRRSSKPAPRTAPRP